MGHRATFAIRERGELSVYYSHWGGLSIPEDIFWGPGFARAFIVGHEATDEWLDDVWAEGGVALDVDTQTVAFFGCSELAYPPLADHVVELMQAIWHPWSVRRVDDITEIAAQVGLDPESVRAEPIPPIAIEADQLGANLADNFYCGLISIAGESGWTDYALEYNASMVVALGPPLLEMRERLIDLDGLRALHRDRPLRNYEEEKRPLGDELVCFIAVDPARRRLAFTANDPRVVEQLAGRWPGWSVEAAAPGIASHFRATDRALPADLVPSPQIEQQQPPPPSREETLAEIAERLFSSEERKAEMMDWVRGALAAGAADGAVVTLAPGVLDAPQTAIPDTITARRLFESAVRAIARQ